MLIVILYLNGQKYSEQAREYRKNYTELQKLEFELNNIDGDDVDLIKNIYNRYCDLLDSSRNHISFDYYETVHGSTGEYKSKKWRNVRCRYYYNVIWRFVLKICVYSIAGRFMFDMWGFIDASIVLMEKIIYKKTSYRTL